MWAAVTAVVGQTGYVITRLWGIDIFGMPVFMMMASLRYIPMLIAA